MADPIFVSNFLGDYTMGDVNAVQANGLDEIEAMFALREEARKLWDYAVTDECVYISQMVGPYSNIVTASPTAKQYRRSEVWVEVLLLTRDDKFYAAIIECASSQARNGLNSKRPNYTPDRDGSMLVNIPKMVEPPQRMLTKQIASVVRLQCLDNIPRSIRDALGDPSEMFAGLPKVSLAQIGNSVRSNGLADVRRASCQARLSRLELRL